MSASLHTALTTYKNIAGFKPELQDNPSIPGQNIAPAGDSFSRLVSQTVSDVATPLHHADRVVAQSLLKKADISEAVSALTQAELLLKTVVNIRDRLVAAHQEILRMPI